MDSAYKNEQLRKLLNSVGIHQTPKRPNEYETLLEYLFQINLTIISMNEKITTLQNLVLDIGSKVNNTDALVDRIDTNIDSVVGNIDGNIYVRVLNSTGTWG